MTTIGTAATDDAPGTRRAGRPSPAPAPVAVDAATVGPRPADRRTGRRSPVGGLHRPEPVAVLWDERRRRPSAFTWRGRRHRIDRVVELWVVETGWWSDQTHVSRSYWRVEVDGRLLDLCYDRLNKAWSLERTLN